MVKILGVVETKNGYLKWNKLTGDTNVIKKHLDSTREATVRKADQTIDA